MTLLDEPFSSLDIEMKSGLQAMLAERLAVQPATVLYVSHAPEEVRQVANSTLTLTADGTSYYEWMGATGEEYILPVLSLLIFPMLAWFTHKHALLATWCTVLLLIMTGSGFLYDAFVNLAKSGDPDFLPSLFRIVFGTYLTWGALIIHRERHTRD